MTSRWMNLVRAVSTEGFGRAKYYREIRNRLDTDPQFPPYFEQESSVVPAFYKNIVSGSRTPDGVASRGRSLSRSKRLLEVRALQGLFPV